MRVKHARKGISLLEVVVAMALLGLIGLSSLELVRLTARLADAAVATEDELSEASALLHAMSLWSRTELDQRLGERVQGPWRVEISRIESDLYLVAIRDSSSYAALLSTALYSRHDDATF